MSIIVEDGTGMSTSETFASVSFCDTYHANQGNAAWALIASTALKEQALRRAMTYLTGEYRQRWAGTRTSLAQALDWPRYMVPVQDIPGGFSANPAYVPGNVIPVIIQNVVAELALKASVQDLAPDVTRGVLAETVGPISVEYDPHGLLHTTYRAIDMALEPYLRFNGGTNVKVFRG